MMLNSDEIAHYEQRGGTFLSELAEAINYSCPIARGSASAFKERNVDAQYSDVIGNAVERWRATHNAA
ncbi:hypothetical protein ABWL39_20300 [Chitinivorax sp. PXF-14]|uniref:hypothetical protein n=1 Tax=Chitinivorax sp. PXF-14 TaxID=3230488 RepID=UPI00346567E6